MRHRAADTEAEIRAAQRRLDRLLEQHGLLLVHDAKLPSATACIAGAPVPGSWWGHSKGKLIYEVLVRLEPSVAWVKLIAAKETLVPRRLWPALVAAAGSGQAWQRRGLAADARALLRRLRPGGRVQIDRELGAAATELERRLLAHGTSEHTPQGHHVRFLETWGAWAKRNGIAKRDLPAADGALRALSSPVSAWIGGGEPRGLLPWFPKR